MASTVEQWLERTLATAPPLSTEQRTRLAELLRPARQELGRELMLKARATSSPVDAKQAARARLRNRLRRNQIAGAA